MRQSENPWRTKFPTEAEETRQRLRIAAGPLKKNYGTGLRRHRFPYEAWRRETPPIRKGRFSESFDLLSCNESRLGPRPRFHLSLGRREPGPVIRETQNQTITTLPLQYSYVGRNAAIHF